MAASVSLTCFSWMLISPQFVAVTFLLLFDLGASLEESLCSAHGSLWELQRLPQWGFLCGFLLGAVRALLMMFCCESAADFYLPLAIYPMPLLAKHLIKHSFKTRSIAVVDLPLNHTEQHAFVHIYVCMGHLCVCM